MTTTQQIRDRITVLAYSQPRESWRVAIDLTKIRFAINGVRVEAEVEQIDDNGVMVIRPKSSARLERGDSLEIEIQNASIAVVDG